MKLEQFANAQDQLDLWKLVNDAVCAGSTPNAKNRPKWPNWQHSQKPIPSPEPSVLGQKVPAPSPSESPCPKCLCNPCPPRSKNQPEQRRSRYRSAN